MSAGREAAIQIQILDIGIQGFGEPQTHLNIKQNKPHVAFAASKFTRSSDSGASTSRVFTRGAAALCPTKGNEAAASSAGAMGPADRISVPLQAGSRQARDTIRLAYVTKGEAAHRSLDIATRGRKSCIDPFKMHTRVKWHGPWNEGGAGGLAARLILGVQGNLESKTVADQDSAPRI